MQVALVADSCPQLAAATSRLARFSCVFLLRSLLQSSNPPHLVFLFSSSILLRPLSSAPSPLSLMSLPSSIVPPLSGFSSFILPFSSFLPHVLLRPIFKYSPFVSSSLLFRSFLMQVACTLATRGERCLRTCVQGITASNVSSQARSCTNSGKQIGTHSRHFIATGKVQPL